VIPDEAIEAAHRAWREQAALDGSIFEYNLRAALEAAAPFIAAVAWERGWVAREDLHAYDVWGGEGEEPDRSNPYKE